MIGYDWIGYSLGYSLGYEKYEGRDKNCVFDCIMLKWVSMSWTTIRAIHKLKVPLLIYSNKSSKVVKGAAVLPVVIRLTYHQLLDESNSVSMEGTS